MNKTRPRLALGSLVYVEWADHSMSASVGWVDLDKAKALRPAVFTTVGFVAHEDDDCLVLMATIDSDLDCASGVVCILQCAIKSLAVLAKPKTRIMK